MALATLLDHIIDEKLTCNVVIGDQIIINETAVKSYELNGHCCCLYTNEGHKIKLDLSKFKKVTFNEAPYEPTTPLKMEHYLQKFNGSIPYDAYLETANDMFIAGFYNIEKIEA